MKTEPRTLRVHSVQLKVDVAPRSGATLSKLRTVEETLAPDASGSRADAEMVVMQNAFADVAQEMLRSGVCD